LLVLGILFLILGLITILRERYTIIMIEGQRNIEKKPINKDNNFNRYKILLGIFSIILGILCILNYIIY